MKILFILLIILFLIWLVVKMSKMDTEQKNNQISGGLKDKHPNFVKALKATYKSNASLRSDNKRALSYEVTLNNATKSYGHMIYTLMDLTDLGKRKYIVQIYKGEDGVEVISKKHVLSGVNDLAIEEYFEIFNNLGNEIMLDENYILSFTRALKEKNMNEKKSNKLFTILLENSIQLADNQLGMTMADELHSQLTRQYGEDFIENAFVFENMALLYTHLSSVVLNKHPDEWLDINKNLMVHFSNYFQNTFKVGIQTDYMNLFLTRVVQYDGADLKILLTNVKNLNYRMLKPDLYIPIGDKTQLLNNSELFYYWNKNPMATKSLKYTLTGDEAEHYQWFLDDYFKTSLKLMKETIEVLN